MRQKSHSNELSSEEIVKNIRRATRKRYSAEEKIRIVLDGLRGEHSIAELCRREGIAEGLYYSWSKEFLEAGKRRLAGDTARAATSDEVKDLQAPGPGIERGLCRAGARAALAQKKHDRGWGRRGMRFPGSEKLEIMRLVEQSHLPARRTLEMLGIRPSTFYRWYERYRAGGPEALEDKPSKPDRVWNRIPDDVRELKDAGMFHVRGAPCHPQTQGKIERWHQTLKNRILLDNYYLPGDLEAHIDRFVDHYNHRRYHESLQNLTPADVYFGRGQTILLQRERIKRETIKHRRLQHQRKAA